MTLKRCFGALANYCETKRKTRMLMADVSESMAIRSLQRSFSTWFNIFQSNVSLRQTAICLNDARDIKLMQKSLHILRDNAYRKIKLRSVIESKEYMQRQKVFDALVTFTKTQQSRKAQKSLVELFRRR